MIRPVDSDPDLERCLEILAAVDGMRLSLDQLRPVRERLLLHASGDGYAFVTPSSVSGSAYAMLRVLPAKRGRGIGSELLIAASDAVRALRKQSAWGIVRPDDPPSLRFAESRGFREVGRDVKLTRQLARGEGRLPPGVVELREEHRRGAHAVALAAVPDMATAGEPKARPYDDWVEHELADAAVAFAAVEDGLVVGYATLQRLGGDPKRLEHGFTGVLPTHRGRGIGTKLGEAEIAWASAHGYDELVSTTGVANVPLRRQKARLEYAEEPGDILVRGLV